VVAFLADAVVTIAVSLVTRPKPEEELRGLVWGLPRRDAEPERMEEGDELWYRSPWLLGAGAIVLVVILNIVFI
jgi:solute:Na+ symporter, SSS family